MVSKKELDNLIDAAAEMLVENKLVDVTFDEEGKKVYRLTPLGEQYVKVRNSGKKPD